MKTATTAALVGLAAVCAAVGAGTGFFVASPTGGTAAAQSLVDGLEARGAEDLEVMQVEEERGMFKVDVRAQDRVQTYYTSPTGDLFFAEDEASDPNMLERASNQRQRLGECLRNKQAVLYGNVSQRATRLQIGVLGEQNLDGVYLDVNNRSVLRAAVQQGVRRTPAFTYNGSALTGVNDRRAVADFTGCDLDADR